MFFSGSLLSSDAMFFSFGSQFLGEKCIFLDRYFSYLSFQISVYVPYSKTIQGTCIWMDLYRDVDRDDQARCIQVA